VVRSDEVASEFDAFVGAHSGELLRTAYLVTWDLAAAEELVQEALFEVARRWPRVRTMEHPRAYARTVLVHRAIDGAGRRGRHRDELDERGRPALDQRGDARAEREIERVDDARDLVAVLGQLAPRQRAALVLRYVEDLSEAQTAEVLGCSVGTVKSSTARALANLRARLDPPAQLPTDDPTTEGEPSYGPAVRH
jgi:RNA polymerase sigma-70 factor (sigma-E family)